MSLYPHLVELYDRDRGLTDEQRSRLLRLIMGYHATELFFRTLVRSDAHVADVGCHFGQWSVPLLDMADRVSLIDHTDARFDYLKKLTAPAGNAELVCHDLSRGTLAEGAFDVVLCMGTLYYIPAQSLDAFIGNLVKSLKPGGHLLVDRRIPTRLHVWQNFVLRAHPLVVKLYPHLRDDLSLPRVPFRTLARAAADWLLRLGDYYRRRLVQILFRGRSAGVERRFRSLLGRGPEPDAIIAHIASRLERYGLREVDAAGLIDMDQYKICRDVEGYNLRNTFVGNYFWVRVYRKT